MNFDSATTCTLQKKKNTLHTITSYHEARSSWTRCVWRQESCASGRVQSPGSSLKWPSTGCFLASHDGKHRHTNSYTFLLTVLPQRLICCIIGTHQTWWRHISGKDQMDIFLCHPHLSSQESAFHLHTTAQTHIFKSYILWFWWTNYTASTNTVWTREHLNLSYHVITLRIKGIGSTHIHPVIFCLMKDPDIVLAVHLEMCF